MILAASHARLLDQDASEWEAERERLREQIRSANSLRLFRYLSTPVDARPRSPGLGKHLMGPAMQGIRCAALRAGLDPDVVLPRLRGGGADEAKPPRGAKKKSGRRRPKRQEASAAEGLRAPAPAPQPKGLTTVESAVLASLSDVPEPLESVAMLAAMPRQVVRAALERLASLGLAQQVPGSGWASGGSDARGRLRVGDVVEDDFALFVGDAEERLGLVPDESVDAIVTSSPYYRERHYGAPGEIGWEPTPVEFVTRLLGVLRQCARVLKPHGLIFFNFDDHVDRGQMSCVDDQLMTRLGEAGLVKFRKVIWVKTAHVPNGTDNAPAHDFETVFVLKKPNASHYWDQYLARVEAKSGGMKRMGDVWTLPPACGNGEHSRGRHFAAFPPALVRLCLDVGTSEKGYCPDCGKPWVRVLERGESTWKKVGATHARARDAARRTGKADDGGARDERGRGVYKQMADMRHVRWQPSCGHRKSPEKAMVLDPFVGSGTTGIVSAERACGFIGIDVNPSNVALSAEGIREAIARRRSATAKGRR